MKKTFKLVFKISLCVWIVLIAFFGIKCYLTCSVISQWIADENVVYVPRKPATEFDHDYLISLLGLEDHDFWKVKLSENDVERLNAELDNGKWEKIDYEHLVFLGNNTYLGEYNVYSEINNSDNVYICIYDSWDSKIANDCNLSSDEMVVFIYDVDDSLYLCHYMNL